MDVSTCTPLPVLGLFDIGRNIGSVTNDINQNHPPISEDTPW